MNIEVKEKVLFDEEIKDRQVTRWNTVTFQQFRRNKDCEEMATHKYLEFVI